MLSNFVTGFTASDGSVAMPMAGTVPPPGGGPGVTATASGSVSSGGSDVTRLVGSLFQTVYMSVEGVDGFLQARLSAAMSDVTITATLGPNIPRSYTAVYRVASAAGAVGATASVMNTVRPSSSTSAFFVIFNESPVPFRNTGCNASIPRGWYTGARLQETSGVTFTPSTLVQKLDGNVASFLVESFASRFGACGGSASNPGVILANGAVCGTVGVCTASTFSTYQFSISGTDANGHAVTFDSPLLQLGPRPAGQSTRLPESSPVAMAPTPILR